MNKLTLWFHQFGSPPTFYRVAGLLMPWCYGIGALLGAIALYGGLVLAPADYQQGDAFRIIFLHVPTAWMSLFIYFFMAANAFIALVWRIKISETLAMASAPVGAAFTFICLVTGSLWGKPMWGTWWVWDARLTSELILLFLYLGFLALQSSIDDPRRADKAGAVLALVGVVNVPIIYFSVVWWNTLHQGASVSLNSAPSMAAPMLWGMLIMVAAFWMYTIAAVLARVRNIILDRERHTEWVKNAVE